MKLPKVDKTKIERFTDTGTTKTIDSDKCYLQTGLTKREHLAGLAMQGLCANPHV